jgi:dolichol-phosphate mannosyltransferase
MHRYLPALFLMRGHEVDYLTVNDRPRTVGQSKYNNLGRALIGIYDLIGVRWLGARTTIPRIAEAYGGNAMTETSDLQISREARTCSAKSLHGGALSALRS